jgi:hypothetical protein
MTRKSVSAFLALVVACVAVAFVVIAVMSEGGGRVVFAILAVALVAVAGALLRVGTAPDRAVAPPVG